MRKRPKGRFFIAFLPDIRRITAEKKEKEDCSRKSRKKSEQSGVELRLKRERSKIAAVKAGRKASVLA